MTFFYKQVDECTKARQRSQLLEPFMTSMTNFEVKLSLPRIREQIIEFFYI
jgi:hypothetical protein